MLFAHYFDIFTYYRRFRNSNESRFHKTLIDTLYNILITENVFEGKQSTLECVIYINETRLVFYLSSFIIVRFNKLEMLSFTDVLRLSSKTSLIHKSAKHVPKHCKRCYATERTDESLHTSRNNRLHDPLWPASLYPTPYEIFGIESLQRTKFSTVELNKLKKEYHKYVKLYHPDLSQSRDILDASNRNKLLTVEEKISRFKMISQAYDILTNPNKKNIYDLTRSNWSHNGPNNINNSDYTRGFSSDAANEYWHAGTWEDINNFNMRQANHETEDASHKYVYFWAFGMLICIEGSVLLTNIENSLIDKKDYGITNQDIEQGLLQSYENYGLDDDKLSRIRRFLWFRSWGLYIIKEDLDREAESNEMLINTISDKIVPDLDLDSGEHIEANIIDTQNKT